MFRRKKKEDFIERAIFYSYTCEYAKSFRDLERRIQILEAKLAFLQKWHEGDGDYLTAYALAEAMCNTPDKP